MKSVIHFFSSVKLAIVLIIIIAGASVVGTLIPQLRSPQEYVARYGQFARFLMGLELTDLYHSWWYITLLFFFSLNILICTLSRVSPKFRRVFKPNVEFNTKALLSSKIHQRYKKGCNLENAEAELKTDLRSRHFRIKEKGKDEIVYLLARKRTLGLFGSDVVHFGILVILIGGIFSGVGGIRANINISEGQTVPVLHADFKLRLDSFETEFYPNGSVKDWKSTLTVIENESSRLTKTIEVNHPLSYKGYVFYQSSYGWDWKNPVLEIWIKKKSDPSLMKKMSLRLGEKVSWEEEDIEFSALQFVPDFVIDGSQVQTRSLEPHNPAAFIEAFQGGDKVSSGWVFAKFPDFSRMHSEKDPDYTFELKDIQAAQYSGIQMSKDPGVNFIWAGSALLMVGLFMAFYWLPREIRFTLKGRDGKTEIIAAGKAKKGKLTLESEFNAIMASLRRSN